MIKVYYRKKLPGKIIKNIEQTTNSWPIFKKYSNNTREKKKKTVKQKNCNKTHLHDHRL